MIVIYCFQGEKNRLPVLELNIMSKDFMTMDFDEIETNEQHWMRELDAERAAERYSEDERWRELESIEDSDDDGEWDEDFTHSFL